MSKRRKSKTLISAPNIVALFSAVCLAFSLAWVAFQSPCSGIGFGRPSDYLILIETDEDKSEFNYPGSIIGPVVKAKVSYSQPNKEEKEPPVDYETLWYHEWQALGCRRLHTLDIPVGNQITLEVRHRYGLVQMAEAQAAANAILRLYVDAFAQRNCISSIIVPDESISLIANEMGHAGFYVAPPAPPDQPVICPIILTLVTKSGANKQILYYGGPQYDNGGGGGGGDD